MPIIVYQKLIGVSFRNTVTSSMEIGHLNRFPTNKRERPVANRNTEGFFGKYNLLKLLIILYGTGFACIFYVQLGFYHSEP
jgi:hypothetical protein